MSGAEVAALRLGTTVANTAAQMWLGGKRQEQERRLPLDELVRVRVPGLRLQRSVKRQFEEMADAAAARMEPFLTHEFRGLDKNGREAAINGVCDTFAAADLSDEAVLAADANPAELVRRITRAVQTPVGLNEVEERFYRLLFTECCQYYVSIVRSLPAFEERTLAELLERSTSLGTDVKRILERLPDRSLFAPDGTDQDAGFRRLYMDLVSNNLDEVELFRRTSDRAAAQVRLSVAYVSLRTTGDTGTRRAGGRSSPLLRPDMSDWEEPGAESSGMQVEAALGGASRVLLRGEAGSGKTTLLRWLAITAARGAFTTELADWNGLTPVFVKLREYSGRPLPRKPEELLDGVAGAITGIMPKAWVERQLGDGKVLLLVDGVDELQGGERRSVREWLRRLLGTYNGIRVVVTSRPTAASVDWLRKEDFTALHLDRMTPPDLAAFVRRWHQAVRELGDDLPCAVDELPRYEQSLLNSLKDRPHLPSLAGTPLLAAMLCAMHLNRGSQLPRDRMELYKNALDTLVHDRDTERNVPSAVDSKLSLGDKLVILRDLAWRLSDNNRSEISMDQAAVHVGRKLAAMRHLDVQDSHGVLGQLLERSGILRDPVQGRLDFVHRTFQEYLAAEEATEEDRIGNLVGRAHLDLWRETIIMAAGHANTRQREELLGGILDRAEMEPRHTRALRLLAAACQETLPSISGELADRLDEAVSALLPAHRQTDPPALAAVGTSLLRRLPRSLAELTEKAAVQTVRTVALIGGEAALSLLAGYADDDREPTVAELIRAWAYFDADAYADQVLTYLPLKGHSVSLTHSGQWQAATRLTSITNLWIEYPLPELAALDQLPPLEFLYVQALSGVGDMSVFAAHPDLHDLTVMGRPGQLKRLETVENLQNLNHLRLGLRGTADLGGLRLGQAVSGISLFGVSETTDLGTLSGYSDVSYLFLSGNDICTPHGLSGFSAMSGLKTLTLNRFNLRTWLTVSERLPPSLQQLTMNECIMPDGSAAFSGLDSLESVLIAHCHTPDDQPVTALHLPGVDVTVA
ncbi:NACHT domain-containing protein [Streptomyces sp. NBC_00878]|uniref:NACHT N-terminal Helical domain 1-containing protein n=1 Tax=Streptomyces sp. NBC_00878 TaxID=2975854 RepID=UPI002255E597|nr:NACHT domain-containing protein [Streptomyces sp. NBC_00878]MCX4905160.1 NACHT domain-containing protein [Streptomyces sp. NBC_00878]